MGFALQRGATCTVAAVGEIMQQGSYKRLIALIEAAIWVLGGLLLGNLFGLMQLMPNGYRLSTWTIIGAVSLGLGAAINRGCVLGTVARIGNGDWSYLATPLGFFVGCLLVQHPSLHLTLLQPQLRDTPSPVWMAPAWLGLAIGAWILWRIGTFVIALVRRSRATDQPERHTWAPHEATLVIAMCFLSLLWLSGPWTYTDVLAEQARGGMPMIARRTGLLLTLLLGAISAGITSGAFKPTPLALSKVLKCFTGGALMGIGSIATPGGNDGLILVGMPLLWPHAWIAFITMCVTIVLYFRLTAVGKAA